MRKGTNLSLDHHMLEEIVPKTLYDLETETWALASWVQVTDQVSERWVSRQ